MADYKPPFRDIFFVLDNLVDVGELCEFEPFKHIDPDTIKDVLEEDGRFVSEVIAPLNRSGDLEGSVHDPKTNEVKTPAGFKEAYAQYVAAGWGGVPFDQAY